MKLYKTVLIFTLILGLAFSSYSDCGFLPPCVGDAGEIPGDVNTPGANCCNTNVTVPFDGGISLLLAAGLGIGVRSVIRKKKAVQ